MLTDRRIAIIIPALNEADALAGVLAQLPEGPAVVVADNGSTDRTAELARAGGATVVHESRRGYGAACLAGLRAVEAMRPTIDIVVFMDADASDDPADLPALLRPLETGAADLVIGSRVLGQAQAGALSMPQRFGNALASGLLRRIWSIDCTDLGPFRAVPLAVLRRLGMSDLGYGWTVQMQARAARMGYRIAEVPVAYRKRIGRSKISGTVRGVCGAGGKILTTLGREWLADRRLAPRRERLIVFTRLPEPGVTKTRMIPALGEQGAADLQREMTRHTLRVAADQAPRENREVEVRFTGSDRAAMAATFGPEYHYTPQGEGDLGEKLNRAFTDGFTAGRRRVVCIGSDCPGITADLLDRAFAALNDHEVVLGPAEDGGYYLIGARRPIPRLFADIAWGGESVLAQTRQRIAALGLKAAELPPLRDVDEPEDLPVWQAVRDAQRPEGTVWISVVIPALNEVAALAGAIRSAQTIDGVEVILADGGSTDGTVELAGHHGVRVVRSSPGRGVQMNAGAAEARGEVLLFLHADTRLPFGWDREVRRVLHTPGAVAGAFRMAFDEAACDLRMIEWGTDLRARGRGLPYGDQALFMTREVFEAVGGFPEQPIMEDYTLVQRLRRRGRVVVSPLPVITAARTYRRAGPWRTVLTHQRRILRWHLDRARPGRSTGGK